jgi:peptidoglycan lytic transglycosylase
MQCLSPRLIRVLLLPVFIIGLMELSGCASSAMASSGARSAPTTQVADNGAAITAMGDVIRGLKDFEKRARGYSKSEWKFVLGYAHYKYGRWQSAESSFAKIKNGLPILDDYILHFRGASAMQLGRDAEAIQFFGALDLGYPKSVWILESSLEWAQSLIALRRCDEARALLAYHKKKMRGRDMREADVIIAKSYIAEGNSERSLFSVRELATGSGNEAELSEISGLMADVKRRFRVNLNKWLAGPDQQYALAKSFVAHSQWDEAAVRLQAMLAKKPSSQALVAQSRWLLARCMRWMHRYDEAIALMEGLIKNPNASSMRSSVMMSLATTYAKKDDYEKAISIRRRIISGISSRSTTAARLTYSIAFLYMDEGRYARAATEWRRVLRMRLGRKRSTLARWYLGWSLYKDGKHANAIRIFDGMRTRDLNRARIRDRVHYWKGRALLEMGKKSQAKKEFNRVIADWPTGYYAELARRRLAGHPTTIADFVPVKWKGVSKTKWKPTISSADKTDFHMARALELDKLGLHEEVARELVALDIRKQPELVKTAIWLGSKNYAYNRAYGLVRYKFKNEVRNASLASKGFDRFLLESYYPKAYRSAVESRAIPVGVDPLLVWSIMRNESAFKPRVLSPAGAMGLMQLIPTTANRMAKSVFGGPIDRRRLYNPPVNIALGVEYLKELFKLFPGNAVACIASYNAGEEAAGRWIKNGAMKDVEGWIEEIPYSETNLYVKKVMTSYWNYQRLYKH